MIPLRMSEDALQDLNEGFLFYEAQEEGLGDYFASCLRADIESLRVHAGIHPPADSTTWKQKEVGRPFGRRAEGRPCGAVCQFGSHGGVDIGELTMERDRLPRPLQSSGAGPGVREWSRIRRFPNTLVARFIELH